MKIFEWIIRIVCFLIIGYIVSILLGIVSFLLWDDEYLEYWVKMIEKILKLNKNEN